MWCRRAAALRAKPWFVSRAGAHVITIAKAPGKYIHNTMEPAAGSPGTFVVNSKVVAGDSVDAMIQRWLASPAGQYSVLRFVWVQSALRAVLDAGHSGKSNRGLGARRGWGLLTE